MPFYLLVYNIISIDPMLRFRSMMLFYIISLAFVLFSQLITSVYANPMLSANQTSSNTIIQQAVTQNSVQESCKTCNVLVFSENGLPQGLEWEVLSINGNTLANAITPNMIVVNYSFLNNVSNTITIPDVISANMTYTPSPNTMLLSSNQFNGTAVLNISFSSYVKTSFSEEGLPTGTLWSISYGNKTESFIGNTIIFRSMAGNYPVSIPDITSGSRLYAAQSPAYVISGETVALNFSGNYIIAQPPTENTTVNESAANISTGMQKLNSTHANTSIQGKLSKALNESFKKYGLGNGVLIMQWQGSNSNLNGTAVKNSNYHSSAISKYNQTNQTSQSLYNGNITSTTNQAIQLNYTTMDNLTSLNITKANAFRTYINSSYPSLLQLQHNITVGYGSIRQSNKVVAAGRRLEFITYNENSTLVYYNVSVVKSTPNMSIEVDGAYLNRANTTAKVHIPIISHQKTYNLSVSLQSLLGNNNYAEYSYSIKFSNGSIITGSGNYTSFNKNFYYKIPYTQNATITFDTSGNSNFTAVDPTIIVIPTKILYYVPITFTNSQTTGISNPSQLNLTVNSLSYNAYEASNLDNIEFFYVNGTIVPSWLEGNVLNAQQTANLYTSENTVYWLKVTGSFLPASSSNTLYMGFAATTQNLFDGVATGEAPQLSASYGQYDDGSGVFLYYNVNPTSTTGWSISGTAGHSTAAPPGDHYQTSNAFYANSANGDYMHTSLPSLGTNEVISFDVYTTGLGNMFFLTSSSGSGQMVRLDGRGGSDYSGIASAASWTSWSAPPSGLSESEDIWYKYDVVITSTSAASYIGPASDSLSALGTKANTATLADNGNYIGLVGDALGSSYITYWNGFVIRTYPPNGVMPAASFGTLVSSGVPQLYVQSNPALYQQSNLVTATATPNTDSVEILVNGVVKSGPAAGTTSYNTNQLSVGTYTLNALDVNTGNSSTLNLVIGELPSLSISSNPVNQGQSDLITATATPNTDSVEILVNGVVESGPSTGTSTFNSESLLSGVYTITAKDINTGFNVSQTLSVNCEVTPTSVPSGIGNYACIEISNQQSSAAPSPFQEMLIINSSIYKSYEAGNLQNIEFFNKTGSIVPSWMESGNTNTSTGTVYWLRITNTILGNPSSTGSIPASSNTFLYIGFAPLSTNLFNNVNTGEAPQLSASYGQYDDGAGIFDVYYNGSEDTGWTTAGTAGVTASAPSGSPFGSHAFYANSANGDYLYTFNGNMPSSNFIITSFWYTTALGDSYFLTSSSGSGQMTRLGCGSGWYGVTSTSSWTSWTAPPDSGPSCDVWYKVDTVVSGTSATAYYSSATTSIATIGSNPSASYSISDSGQYIGFIGDGASSGDITYWNGFLIRAYPPNGVMPQASYGPVQSSVQNTCTISLNHNAVNFGNMNPGTSISTSNSITDTNSGNTNAYLYLYGGNWVQGLESFGVSNTIYADASGVAYSAASKLTSTATNSMIQIAASSSNTIYLGLNIPPATPSSAYGQTITIENVC